MKVKFTDPIIQEKLINHADYVIPPTLPKKPSNPNRWSDWRERCQEIKRPSTEKNALLYKTIWEELNKEESA
tara:strand:- start:20 stop:235 length:216 start_codon:yes stop_codon:yes gene_type:complete